MTAPVRIQVELDLRSVAAEQVTVRDHAGPWSNPLSGADMGWMDLVEVTLGDWPSHVRMSGDLDSVTAVFAEVVRRLGEINRDRAEETC